MILSKKKQCDGCGEQQIIWKNDGGKRFCKRCWSAHSNTLKPKPTGKHKPIPPRSPKRIAQDLVYKAKRLKFLKEYPVCGANLSGICTTVSTDVHHKAGRTGELFLNEEYWIALCRACHSWTELHPVEAKEMGLSLNRL